MEGISWGNECLFKPCLFIDSVGNRQSFWTGLAKFSVPYSSKNTSFHFKIGKIY